MGDLVEDVSGQLRKIAVELVRTGKSADAAAVLASIGAVEMLTMFAGGTGPAQIGPPALPSPGY